MTGLITDTVTVFLKLLREKNMHESKNVQLRKSGVLLLLFKRRQHTVNVTRFGYQVPGEPPPNSLFFGVVTSLSG